MVYNVFGYKVHKENGTPFGYDMENNELVANPIEAEIVKYVFETQADPAKQLDEIPKEWTEYLTQKNEECEKLEKTGNMHVVKPGNPEELKKPDHEPIIDLDMWTRVMDKISTEEFGESAFQMDMQ